MKFGIEVSCRRLSNKGEFCEYRRNDGHILRMGVNEFTHVISTFCGRIGRNSEKEDLHLYCLTVIIFVRIRVVKAVLM